MQKNNIVQECTVKYNEIIVDLLAKKSVKFFFSPDNNKFYTVIGMDCCIKLVKRVLTDTFAAGRCGSPVFYILIKIINTMKQFNVVRLQPP